jgi:glycosyltransferase involved in cell wall biosynthesis
MDRIPHRLVIAGGSNQIFKKDPQVKSLLEKIPKEKIEFKGYLDEGELFELYRRASLFVFPSFYEGFGFPPLEAMACGCPVIVSQTPSLMEVCGDAAHYIDPDDVESIAAGMLKVLSDEELQRSLIQKGLERARLFSGEQTVSALLRVFERVLGAGP